MSRLYVLAVVLTLAAALDASALVDRYFKGKKEDDICKEFLKKLPESLKAWLNTKNAPRATLTVNKIKVYSELSEVLGKGDANVWGELVKKQWYTNQDGAVWALNDMPNTRFRVKNTDIPPADIGGWFDGKRDDPALLVGLCVWLAKNNELAVANQRLTELVAEKKEFRADVEAWLCEKYKWTLPEQGLRMIAVRDLETGKAYGLMLSEDAHKDHMSKLDSKAKAALDALIDMRGDTDGELGARKKAPTERLDELKVRCNRYPECFRDTPTAGDAEQMKRLEKLVASLDADLEVVKNIQENAEGYIKQDPEQAAKNFEKLHKADPQNPNWRARMGYAYHLAGGLHWDGGCDKPKLMKLAGEIYEPLCKEYPMNGNLFTFCGACFYATGERDKAKKYLQRAVDLLEDGDGDKDFAERLLKNLK